MAQKQVRSGRGSDAPEPVSPVTGDAVKDELRRLRDRTPRVPPSKSTKSMCRQKNSPRWTPPTGAGKALRSLCGRACEMSVCAEIEGGLAGVTIIELRLLPTDQDGDKIGRAAGFATAMCW